MGGCWGRHVSVAEVSVQLDVGSWSGPPRAVCGVPLARLSPGYHGCCCGMARESVAAVLSGDLASSGLLSVVESCADCGIERHGAEPCALASDVKFKSGHCVI